jgi:hypothetical protein
MVTMTTVSQQEGSPEVRYTPVPEAIISGAAQQAAMRRIKDISLQLALRSAATMHTFVQVSLACALTHMYELCEYCVVPSWLYTAPFRASPAPTCMLVDQPVSRRYMS